MGDYLQSYLEDVYSDGEQSTALHLDSSPKEAKDMSASDDSSIDGVIGHLHN